MITPTQLRTDFLNILGPFIGTYTFTDKSTEQAIAVLPDPVLGWQYPPQGTNVNGLELIIRHPYPDVFPNLGGDRTKVYLWEIHLKQWDTQGSLINVIDPVVDQLSNNYLLSRIGYMPRISGPEGEKLMMPEQCKFFLKDYVVGTVNS